jgi:hypothetical protein
MVDIIKLPPHAPQPFSSNIHNPRSKAFSQHITLPIYLSTTNPISENDRVNNIRTKRWIGNCPTNPPRLLDVSNSPYSIQRKFMFQELSRHYPSTVDISRPGKTKLPPPPQQHQRTTTKDSTIITTTTTTTATGSVGTNVTSQTALFYGENENSRLFDTLSKHVTIKPEPLRPLTNLTNSTTNTLTTWQRYWTSTHIQRRR